MNEKVTLSLWVFLIVLGGVYGAGYLAHQDLKLSGIAVLAGALFGMFRAYKNRG